MRRRILMLLLALLIGVSMISMGVISAFAGFFNGTFQVDDIETSYEQYQAMETANVGVQNLQGFYRISAEYGPMPWDIDSTDPLLLFQAPAGYYVYFRNNYLSTPLYGFDSIYITQENGTKYIIGVLGDTETTIVYSVPGDNIFYTPVLPTYDGEQNKVFTNVDFLRVIKLGDVDPVPPGGGGGNNEPVYDGVDDVWSDIWDSMVAWLGDADQHFISEGSLTALGLCCAIPMGVGVVMLLVHILCEFLRLRG